MSLHMGSAVDVANSWMRSNCLSAGRTRLDLECRHVAACVSEGRSLSSVLDFLCREPEVDEPVACAPEYFMCRIGVLPRAPKFLDLSNPCLDYDGKAFRLRDSCDGS